MKNRVFSYQSLNIKIEGFYDFLTKKMVQIFVFLVEYYQNVYITINASIIVLIFIFDIYILK